MISIYTDRGPNQPRLLIIDDGEQATILFPKEPEALREDLIHVFVAHKIPYSPYPQKGD